MDATKISCKPSSNTATPTAPSAKPVPPPAVAPDLAAIKTRQQATWASGDFAVIGTTLQLVGETLCEAVDLCTNEKVLDVACGSGNATLAAARRFAKVTGLDYVPSLLARAAARAEADGLSIEFREGDVEKLPFADASFDVVLSTYGCMFAPNQEATASELARVCRPGGRIGLANWTPEGVIGEVFRTVGKLLPPPAGLRSPALWGTEARLEELFGKVSTRIDVTRKNFPMRYASTAHWIEVFRTFYGPVHKAFAALDSAGQTKLDADLTAVLERYARQGTNERGLVVDAEYLEVVIHRK